jgi:hypothetical protein
MGRVRQQFALDDLARHTISKGLNAEDSIHTVERFF